MAAGKSGEPSWFWRRLLLFAVTIFAAYQLHRLVNAPDTRVNDTIAWGWQVLIMVLVLCYTGFATVQDVIAIWTQRSARPYADPPPTPVPSAEQPVVVVQPAPDPAKTQGPLE